MCAQHVSGITYMRYGHNRKIGEKHAFMPIDRL